MTQVNEKRLFDAMAEISDAIRLLESAETKLRVLDSGEHVISVEMVLNCLGAKDQLRALFNDLNKLT